MARLAGPVALLILAGAAVGAIHGAVLAWLLEVDRGRRQPGGAAP
ncbi:hypothetical protein [Corallococcus sicarius]|nr:hypothetical protein [Corallococcus sicarius]